MEFLITAFDGTDPLAPERRMNARTAHLEMSEQLRASGNLLFAAALLDDTERMIGSSMVVRFDSREQLDNWLNTEPYITGGVWKSIEVRRCRPGQAFLKSREVQ